MSKLGNIKESYGKHYSIGVANAESNIVLSGGNLPKNSVIISSPYDSKLDEDKGSFSLIATDSEGNGVRLTYTLQEGNGLVTDGDIIKLDIDNETIKVDKGNSLYIDNTVIVDN